METSLSTSKNAGRGGLTLARKGAILLALPVVVQAFLIGDILVLHSASEQYAVRWGDLRNISMAANDAIFRDVAIANRVHDALLQHAPLNPACASDFCTIVDAAQRIKDVPTSTAADRARIDDMLSCTRKMMDLPAAGNTHGTGSAADVMQKFTDYDRRLFQNMSALAAPRGNLVFAELNKDDVQRKQAMVIAIAGTIFNVLCLIVLSLFFSRDIINRLTVILDNSIRLAMGRQLVPPLPGGDEISDLDRAFHRMADSLTESANKQRALIENARDLLFSLDFRGCFAAVSNAAGKMLGRNPQELAGAYFTDIVSKDKRSDAIDKLKQMMTGRQQPPFETEIVRSDGSTMDVLVSASWSAQDKSLFCVAHDISERKAAERMRQEVIQMVSHDLKSPLTTIGGVHQMMESEMFGALDGSDRQLLSLADRHTNRMLVLINDLLDAERIDAGMLQLDRVYFKLSGVLKKALDNAAEIIESKGIKMISTSSFAELSMYGDEYRIVQVLTNLLSNLAAYAPPGGTISISARQASKGLEVGITADGSPLPPELSKAMFDRFRQMQSPDAATGGSSWLGLAISKSLVELHGGKVDVKSEPGRGTTFSFQVPAPEVSS